MKALIPPFLLRPPHSKLPSPAESEVHRLCAGLDDKAENPVKRIPKTSDDAKRKVLMLCSYGPTLY